MSNVPKASIYQIREIEKHAIHPKARRTWVPENLVRQFSKKHVCWCHHPVTGWCCIEKTVGGKTVIYLERDLPETEPSPISKIRLGDLFKNVFKGPPLGPKTK